MSTERYAVIGGEGFLGHNLVQTLCNKYPGCPVASYDLVQRHFTDKSNPKFESIDLTNLDSLNAAFASFKPTVVFHTASPWLDASLELCTKVNVDGTNTVIQACRQNKVARLVFTSSASVVYDGGNLHFVDEQCEFPAVPLNAYNYTKGIAEKAVLEANGKDGLLTCAIRPSGIFGPGDRQAIPGFLAVLHDGKTSFQIGDNSNLVDYTYVDNVVHAHLLAAEKLHLTVSYLEFQNHLPPISDRRVLPTTETAATALKGEPISPPTYELDIPANRGRYDQFFKLDEDLSIAGQAYFVTNGEPMHFWDFPRLVWREYNGHVPARIFKFPLAIGSAIAALSEYTAWIAGREPSLTRTKVAYSCAHRSFNIEKARRMLGYHPLVSVEEGIKRSVAWYKENEQSIKQKSG